MNSIAKVSVVFGGTRGIGKAIAQRFVRDGHKVAVLSRKEDDVKRVAEQLRSLANETNGFKSGSLIAAPPVYGIPCNITDEASVQGSFRKIEEQLGAIDVLVNAAGVNEDALLLKTKVTTVERLMNTNVVGPMLTCKMALKSMLPRKTGCIVNIGSVVGMKGNVGQSAYSASKAGLIGFTKSLAREVSPRGLRVNIVVPGFIDTDMTSDLKSRELFESMTPLQRFGTPEDVAEAVKLLVTSTYITGSIMYVDGGLHLNY